MEKLWYEAPAAYWDEALPVGNGRLGAMVYGRTDCEVIQLNEESVWSGEKRDRTNPSCRGHLDEIRGLLAEGKIREAEALALVAMSGTPQYQRAYQTLGELRIVYDYKEDASPDKVEGYTRSLDLETASVTSRWEYDGTVYTQSVLASFPADVLLIRITAEGKNRLNITCRLDRDRFFDKSGAIGDDMIFFDGQNAGLYFFGALAGAAKEGTVAAKGEHLLIQSATEAVLLFSAATSFREANPREAVEAHLRRQLKRDASALMWEHIADYQALYNRVALEFGDGGGAEEKLPTDKRLRAFAEGVDDGGLVALYFQYGRYLMISGSRGNGLPLTLQGIWNDRITPPWDSKYTININLQMNYWPVDICNLSECAAPYFALLWRVMESGKETAERMYGCGGFVAHHNTDIHADTAPQDLYIPASYWVMGGAWLATHIWEHYLFTQDKEFLEQNYEVLRQAVLFFEDFLVCDSLGHLVTSPSVSPENTYILPSGERGCMCDAPTMDIEILARLFSDFTNAANVLGKDRELVGRVNKLWRNLPPLQIGKHGQLMEWKEDYEEAEPGHRHISHLYGLFPGNQITAEDTPELARAARVTLERRLANGGGHTGWSRAWIVLLWDRLKDGRQAYGNLRALIGESTYSNLMDFHPYWNERKSVFQIDGNMGGITGIAEMLVQSHNGRIQLLPALPEQLSAGYVKGLKLRGNASIEMKWKDCRPEWIILSPESDMDVKLCYGGRETKLHLKKEHGAYRFDGQLQPIEI